MKDTALYAARSMKMSKRTYYRRKPIAELHFLDSDAFMGIIKKMGVQKPNQEQLAGKCKEVLATRDLLNKRCEAVARGILI